MSAPIPGQPGSAPAPLRPSAIVGAVGFVLVSLLGLASGLGGAIMLAGLYLLPTALYHVVRARSWLSPLLPSSRVLAGVVGVPTALLTTVTGAMLMPSRPATAPASQAAHVAVATTAAATSAPAASATTATAPSATVTATPTPTPSPTPTLPSIDPSVAYATALGAEVPAAPSTVDAGSKALAVLATIPVQGRAPKTGYSRAGFGQEWYDLDRNGCDTRNDILRRDLVDQVIKTGTHGCVVESGTLHDPYTATTIPFMRGSGTSNAVEVDHVVALGDAWQKGAQQLTIGQRTSFANDPLNLLALDGPTNLKKGDGDAATWLPPNTAFRCAYVARQTAVKAKYRLWMTPAEHDAIARILADCPDEPVPTSAVPALVDDPPAPAPTTQPPAPAPTAEAPAPEAPQPPAQQAPAPQAPAATTKAPVPVAQPVPQNPAPADVYYKNCAEVRAAGKAPLRVGQPGYRSGLDADHDGIACE